MLTADPKTLSTQHLDVNNLRLLAQEEYSSLPMDLKKFIPEMIRHECHKMNLSVNEYWETMDQKEKIAILKVFYLSMHKAVPLITPKTTHHQKELTDGNDEFLTDDEAINGEKKESVAMLHQFKGSEKTNTFHFSKAALDKNTIVYQFKKNHQSISFSEMLKLLKNNAHVRELFIQQLAANPFEAFFWECPPVASNTMNQNFEFVLINAPDLSGMLTCDYSVFGAHLTPDCFASSFVNSWSEAMLVCPSPTHSAEYQHLASFSRSAPKDQQHYLWQMVAIQAEKRILQNKDQLIYLTTSGMGVNWLHVRIDKNPRGYKYEPYNQAKVKQELGKK